MFFEEILRELDRRKIRYLVIGGMAVNLYGFNRITGDLDIMVSFEPENLEKLVGMLKNLGWKPKVPVGIEELADTGKLEAWKKEKHMKVFSVYNPEREAEHMDIMIDNPLDFNRAEKKKSEIKAGDIVIPIISIDDLIKTKQIAGRERDKIDIRALKKIRELKNENKI